jgi:hypothetical protein
VRRGGVQPLLAAKNEGPYAVKDKIEIFFTILIGDREDKVSIDWLKPYTVSGPVEVARPPRRGRPPGKPPLQGSDGSGG